MLNLLFVKFLLIFRYRYLVLFGCVEFSLAVMLIYYSVYGWVILLFYEDDAISSPSSHVFSPRELKEMRNPFCVSATTVLWSLKVPEKTGPTLCGFRFVSKKTFRSFFSPKFFYVQLVLFLLAKRVQRTSMLINYKHIFYNLQFLPWEDDKMLFEKIGRSDRKTFILIWRELESRTL